MRVWLFAAPLALLAGCDAVPPNPVSGDPDKGRAMIRAIGCGVCHVIPGVAGARGRVGPSLEGFGSRALIAGVLPNEPALLMRWLQDAPSLVPDTGMPDLPVDAHQARHVAAYLYSLR